MDYLGDKYFDVQRQIDYIQLKDLSIVADNYLNGDFKDDELINYYTPGGSEDAYYKILFGNRYNDIMHEADRIIAQEIYNSNRNKECS